MKEKIEDRKLRTPDSSPVDLSYIQKQLESFPFVPDLTHSSPIEQTLLGQNLNLKPGERTLGPLIRTLINFGPQNMTAVDLVLHDDHESRPTIIIFPPLGESSASARTQRLGVLAFNEQYNVATVNLWGQVGELEHLISLPHAGLSEIAYAVTRDLTQKGLKEIYWVGSSLGGNLILKAAGENPQEIRDTVKGIAVISSAADLSLNSNLMEKSQFHNSILAVLKNIARRRMKFEKSRWGDIETFRGIKTIRDWDREYVAKREGWGFVDEEDYYKLASASPFLNGIDTNTLVIHSLDDPMASPEAILEPIEDNPKIIKLKTDTGGHLGFVADKSITGDPDEFWSHHRVIQYLNLLRQKAAQISDS